MKAEQKKKLQEEIKEEAMRIDRDQMYERTMQQRDNEEYKRREENSGNKKADSVIPDFQTMQEQHQLL